MTPKTLLPLLRSTAHAITWWPLLVGAALGPAILLVPEALSTRLTPTHLTTLTRIAAICVALGAGFVLDDPAARSTPAVPTQRLTRNLARLTLAVPVAILCWVLTLTLADAGDAPLPTGALTLEAATLLATALALAALAQRRNTDGNAGVIAAPAVLALAAAVWLLPYPVALALTPGDPSWTQSHHRWAAVLVAALIAFLWAGHEGSPARLLPHAALSILLSGAGTAFALHNDTPVRATVTATPAWTQIVPGGDCQCADGTRFSFWERRADPAKVVLFLNGGGVCWDARTCAFTGSGGKNDHYNWNDQSGERPYDQSSGFFDLTHPDNPFAGYSIVFVSSCTGDAHLGDTAQPYSPTLTVQHRGRVNGAAALDHLASRYPDAAQVVVIGKTAGSIAAPLYGGLVADRLPRAKVTVFGAQSGAWPDNPDFNHAVLHTAWGAYAAAPAWATDGLDAREWGVPRFWSQTARHAPGVVLGRFDYAYDPAAAVEVTGWMPGDAPDLLSVIDANEAAAERSGATVSSYTAPGRRHGLFEFDRFYELEVGGVRLVDWLTRLVNGERPNDVRCGTCDRE
ncbi:pectin acetylesterase-family hydrolase [Nonomuraea sp. NPDC050663]|uniref:pectin acetylesterase-family hydrolase n=1 Tax=Nonomuraea sp. NPDC050663 TaxID=3364370 RepID=UPI0037ADFAA1